MQERKKASAGLSLREVHVDGVVLQCGSGVLMSFPLPSVFFARDNNSGVSHHAQQC